MSIQSEIDRINNNVASTYSALSSVGADIPEETNSNNLPETVLTIKAVRYDEQTLTDEQKAQARSNIGVTDVMTVTVDSSWNTNHSAAEIIAAKNSGTIVVFNAGILLAEVATAGPNSTDYVDFYTILGAGDRLMKLRVRIVGNKATPTFINLNGEAIGLSDEDIAAALGYTPADAEDVSQLSAEKVSVTPQELTEEQKAQARANIGAPGLNPDCHASYFQITDDGIVSLKPEYRGASLTTAYPYSVSDNGVNQVGSKNSELPKCLYIPEIVDGITVSSFPNAVFFCNEAVENVVLPKTITELPLGAFNYCFNLKNVYNTEHIKKIGKYALQLTSIKRAYFPNLQEITGISALASCGYLNYAHLGNVTSIPDETFRFDVSLDRVMSGNNVTTLGAKVFARTHKLKHVDFMADVASIGDACFVDSSMSYDWNSLTNCTFGTYATDKQLNPTDFWSACTITPCENPLPTLLSQDDPRWTNDYVGNTGKKYSAGCAFMVLLHIYCALKGLTLSTVHEFEDIIAELCPSLLSDSDFNNMLKRKSQLEGLGLTVQVFSEYNQTNLQILYDALSSGKYAIIPMTSGSTNLTGHTVVVYGVNSNGDLLIADSDSFFSNDKSRASTYAMPYHKCQTPSISGLNDLVLIVSL